MPNLKTILKKDIAATIIFILILIALEICFFSNRVFLTGLNRGEDIAEDDIPNASFFVDTMRKGAFPLWNPHKLCGLPFFEVSFMGPYYPLAVLYLFLPMLTAINAGFLIHIFLAGICTYCLMRELRFSRTASFFSASTWMLSSVFQNCSESGWLTETISFSYLPLLIYLFIKAARSAYTPRAIIFSMLSGIGVALVIIGGKPDITLIALCCFVIFSIPSLTKRRTAQLFALTLLIGLSLSAVVWGPLAIQTASYGYPLKLSTHGYAFKELTEFFFPVGIRSGFLGRPALILGLIGLFLGRGRYMANFRFLFALSFIFMFCDTMLGGHKLIDFIPFANLTMYLWLWHAGVIFAFAIFSGAMLEKIRLWTMKKGMAASIITMCTIIGLQLCDAYSANQIFYPRNFKYSLNDYFPSTALTDILRNDRSLFRISNTFVNPPFFRINQGMVAGISCFEARVRGINLYKIIGDSTLTMRLSIHPGGRIFNVCNIKYVITDEVLSQDRFTRLLTMKIHPVSSGDDSAQEAFLYRNNLSFPRAFLLEGVDRQSVEKKLLDGYRAPLMTLRIPDDAWEILVKYKEAAITWTPNIYTIMTESVSDSFLFLSEMSDPGWKAAIDGVPAPISSPFNFFMGVFVPAGTHTIVLRFAPAYFYTFVWISAVSLFVSVLVIVYLIVKLKTLARKTL